MSPWREFDRMWEDSPFASMSAAELEEVNKTLCAKVVRGWHEAYVESKADGSNLASIAKTNLDFEMARCSQYLSQDEIDEIIQPTEAAARSKLLVP